MTIKFDVDAGRSTDYSKLKAILSKYPKSGRLAQDILVSVGKIKKGSLFSSEQSRIQKAQQKIYDLRRSLEAEGFSESGERPIDAQFRFFTEFAKAAPNWQSEYRELNLFIPACLRGLD